MKKSTWLTIIEWTLVINVCIKLFVYGSGKLMGGQFFLKGQIPENVGNIPLAETGSYNLAWTFFGHSQGYIFFIGISQLIGVFLFLIPRTRLLGGAILIPILLNIIIVDYFFGVAYGALFSACLYLASILIVFVMHRDRLQNAIGILICKGLERKSREKKILPIVLIIVGVGLVCTFEYFGISFFGYTDR